MDSGDKASNKAMSIAYKYACFQAFCIPIEADPDAEVYEVTHQLAPQISDADRVITFGKHKGTKWRDLDVRYLQWLLNECANPPAGSIPMAQAEIDRRDRETRPTPESFDLDTSEGRHRNGVSQ